MSDDPWTRIARRLHEGRADTRRFQVTSTAGTVVLDDLASDTVLRATDDDVHLAVEDLQAGDVVVGHRDRSGEWLITTKLA